MSVVPDITPGPGSRIVVEQHGATRVTFRILREIWDGEVEVGRVEVDVAKHLDPRISITVDRLDERCSGPVEVSLR